ncbi:MAG: O-antigen ligase family protein [Methylococcales bacterium]
MNISERIRLCMKHRTILFYLATGLLIGRCFLLFPLYELLTFAVFVPALYVLFKKPELGILSIVVMISSVVFEESLPLIPVAIGSLHISDIILLALFCKVLNNFINANSNLIIKTPLDLPLILFFIVSLYSAYNAVANYGLDFNIVIRGVRTLSYYLLFFAVTNLIREKQQIIIIIKGLYAVAVLVALFMVLQLIVGDAIKLVPGRVENAGTFEEFETLRVLPPGQTLVYCLLISSICHFAMTASKPLMLFSSFLMILLLGAGVLLTYNRTYWVAIILSMALLLAISSKQAIKKTAVLITILTLLVAGVSAYSTATGSFYETRMAVSSRFSSLFYGKKLTESGPVDDRYTENMFAIRKIAESPLLGNGLGNDYRPTIYGDEDILHNYIHNGYLFLLLNTGFIGTLFFLWFYCGFLVRGFGYIRQIQDPYLKSAATGYVLSGAGIVFITFANPIFMQWFSVVVLSIMIGLTEAIIRIYRREANIILVQ